MARSQRRDDEDALDPVEAADQPTDAEEDDLDGFTDVDAEEDEDDLDPAGAELDFDEDAEDDDLPETEADEDDEDALPLLLPDEDLAAVVAETEDDEDEDEEDTLKDGEFVCRSCFMAKRESALADPEAMLCRDCA